MSCLVEVDFLRGAAAPAVMLVLLVLAGDYFFVLFREMEVLNSVLSVYHSLSKEVSSWYSYLPVAISPT